METVTIEVSSKVARELDGIAVSKGMPKEEVAVDLLDEWLFRQNMN